MVFHISYQFNESVYVIEKTQSLYGGQFTLSTQYVGCISYKELA